jgi:hypothetical protein
VANHISPDTSQLAHKVAVGNQARRGVVVWVSIDNGANVATEVEGTFLGWNRIGINDIREGKSPDDKKLRILY